MRIITNLLRVAVNYPSVITFFLYPQLLWISLWISFGQRLREARFFGSALGLVKL
jgi:hypothetical protein